MRLGVLAGALAFLGAASLAHAGPANAPTASSALDACFSATPDLVGLASAAQAGGGAAVEDPGFSDAHASIESPTHLGLWRSDRGNWTIGMSEGTLGGVPARACYARQSSETVPALLRRLAQRFPLFEVMGRTSTANGRGVRESHAALIDGYDALIILEWAGDRAAAYPALTVVTFPRGLGLAEGRTQRL